jgi:hypothetical protein
VKFLHCQFRFFLLILSGPIEKGANDGQTAYAKDIVAALRAAVTKSPVAKGGVKGKGKPGRRKKESDVSDMLLDAHNSAAGSAIATGPSSWGILEPLHDILGPVADIFGAIISPTMMIGFLGALVLYMYLRQSTVTGNRAYNLGAPGMPTHQRMAAYEEMWRGEETELWHWLDERVGMDSMGAMGKSGEKIATAARHLAARGAKAIRDLDGLGEREMLEALRVTRERLEVLEGAVVARKHKRAGSGSTTPVAQGGGGKAVDDADRASDL